MHRSDFQLDHDVVIAGAGPAGSHLAQRLARAGFSVALLDQKRFPRAKPCGEFMSPECLALLDELGMREELLATGARRVRGMRLHGQGTVVEGRFVTIGSTAAPFDHGYALRREVLDTLALERARATPGVTVLERHRVVDLVRDPDGRVCGVEALDPGQRPTAIRARFTIGADGLQSRVAGVLGVRRSVPWLDKLAVVARYAGVPAQDHAEVHFFEGGYFAAAPVDDGLFTLNLVIDRKALPAGGRRAIEDDLAARIAAIPVLAARIGGRDPVEPLRACGPLAGRTTAVTFDGAALLGDACGYVDPVTGEGLFFAMRGAALLATTLTQAMHAGRTDRAALRGYVRARRREFWPRYLMAKLLQRGMRHPRIVRGFLRALAARPSLADLLVSTTGDYAAPHALLDPRVWAGALRRPALGAM